MPRVEPLFVTEIYRSPLGGAGVRRLLTELQRACLSVAADDKAGQAWCKAKGYAGYTSYASLTDLPARLPEFAELCQRLDRHATAYARAIDLDLGRRRLRLDSIWINVLGQGGHHAAHIHPHAALSGTLYVAVPAGAGPIRFEDPRLGLMMAAPPRRLRAAPSRRPFVSISPTAGTVLMWESWLRHEVMPGTSRRPRISISYNYAWG